MNLTFIDMNGHFPQANSGERATLGNPGRHAQPSPCYYLPGDGREVRIRIRTADICYVEATANFSSVFMEGGTFHMCGLTLKQLGDLLPSPHFLRISRSVIVHMAKVVRFDARDVYLENGKEFPFGGKYRGEFIGSLRQAGMLH